MEKLNLVIAQQNSHVGNLEKNSQWILNAVEKAVEKYSADLVLFPELNFCGYPPEDLLLREGFVQYNTLMLEQLVEQLAEKAPQIGVVIGHPQEEGGALYNAASYILDGEIKASYFKHCLPNYSVFDEKRYFSPGNQAVTFALKGVQFGLTICEDIWQPEPMQLAVQKGADIILNLNASPFYRNKRTERFATVSQRAKENNTAIIYANMVGGQDELVFDGGSFSVDHKGKLVQQANSFEEELYPMTLEFEPQNVKPTLAVHGHISASQEDFAETYQTLVVGVRDFVQKNGFKGVLIGLSGGIDSALTLAVAVDALGAENVEVVLMPSQYTSDMSNDDAVEQAKNQGVKYHIIGIEGVFNQFMESLQPTLDNNPASPWDTTEENLQARSRGVILMALSNRLGKMLLTTGNKSEMSVGYATLYGDMAGGYSALKDVPKVLVYELACYRNRISPVIPQRVIDRPPSAELKPDQKDSDSLPDYPVLDAILEKYIESNDSLDEIVRCGYDEELVRKVLVMVDRNEYKRRQAAPGVKITRLAFGRDRRYPITSGFVRQH